MNLFSKKADELAAQLATANQTISELQAKLEAAGTEKTNLEAKITDLTGQLEAANGKVTKLEAKVAEIPAVVEAKVIDQVADAGVPPVTGVITSDSDKAPVNAAEYIAALSKLEGQAAEDYVAKYRENIFGA